MPRKRTSGSEPPKLRAVGEGETAPASPHSPPKTVTEAADGGTTLELYVAMRSRIAEAVESPLTPPRDLAALSKRLGDLQKEIDALKAKQEEEVAQSGPVPDAPFDATAI